MNAAPASGRKAEILGVALTLAFEGGPNRVTTVAIAERLGVTQPAIYRHFRSKADMWAAITERLGAEISENIGKAEMAKGTPEERLRGLVLGHLGLISRTPALPEIMLARDPNSEDAVVRVAMQSLMAKFQHVLVDTCADGQKTGVLKADIDVRDMAALIMGVLQSLVLRLLLTRDVSKLVEDGTRLLDLQLSAFARESEA